VNQETGGTISEAEKLAAFNAIVSEYESALLRYAARIVQHHDAAQNIVQDAFIKLYRNWKDELLPSAQMLSWLYRVTHNCAIDHLRHETRSQLLHVRHAEQRDEFVPPNRGEGFIISDDAEKAVVALRKLTLREQQLVVLKVYEEKSYAEISEITGLTTTNVGYILHYAMKKLVAELKKAKPA